MRTKEEIMKKFIDMGIAGKMMRADNRGKLINPKLHLEVLLDIRELLQEIIINQKLRR